MDSKLKREIILENYQNPKNRGLIDDNGYVKVNIQLYDLDKREFVYSTINNVPAPIRMQPITDFAVNSSCRKTNANTSVIITDSLSIGTTLEASPICKAL